MGRSETIRCGAVLFDLDGVLVDSGAAVERAWARWAARHELDLDHVLAEAHGRRTRDTVRAVAPWLDVEAETRSLEEAESADTDGVVALPGALSLAESLPVERWAVVTSGTRRLATTRMAHAGLRLPNVLVTAEDVAHGKPDPQPYVVAAQALGIEAGRCLVIEDAPAGIAAGRSAGARVLAVATTFAPTELTAADYLSTSLAAVRLHAWAAAGSRSELRLSVETW